MKANPMYSLKRTDPWKRIQCTLWSEPNPWKWIRCTLWNRPDPCSEPISEKP